MYYRIKWKSLKTGILKNPKYNANLTPYLQKIINILTKLKK